MGRFFILQVAPRMANAVKVGGTFARSWLGWRRVLFCLRYLFNTARRRMSDVLFHYQKVDPTTWVYLSSLLSIGLFFKFSRVWSVRNLDLIGLILLAPGLLVVEYGLSQQSQNIEQIGYIWLFATSGLFMIRLLLDPMM